LIITEFRPLEYNRIDLIYDIINVYNLVSITIASVRTEQIQPVPIDEST